MGKFKKGFRTGHVYAGPEPIEKDRGDNDMEQNKKPEIKRPPQKDFEMRCVYAGPEQMRRRDFTPPVQAVYAAPDVMEIARVRVSDADNPFANPFGNPGNNPINTQPYPFNNLSESISKGVAAPGMPGSVSESGGADADTIICPTCGETTRHAKFCECCGSLLK